MHMLHHIPKYIREFGPAWTYWMFVYERSNQNIIKSIKKTNNPEISAIKRQEVFRIYKLYRDVDTVLRHTKQVISALS